MESPTKEFFAQYNIYPLDIHQELVDFFENERYVFFRDNEQLIEEKYPELLEREYLSPEDVLNHFDQEDYDLILWSWLFAMVEQDYFVKVEGEYYHSTDEIKELIEELEG